MHLLIIELWNVGVLLLHFQCRKVDFSVSPVELDHETYSPQAAMTESGSGCPSYDSTTVLHFSPSCRSTSSGISAIIRLGCVSMTFISNYMLTVLPLQLFGVADRSIIDFVIASGA